MAEPIQDWPWDIQYLEVLSDIDVNTPFYRYVRDSIEIINRLIFEIELLRGVAIGAPDGGILFESGEFIVLEDDLTFLVQES